MRKLSWLVVVACIVASGSIAGPRARAEDQAPSPSYSGDFFTRSTLTGDWGGVRNDLAAKGVTIGLDLTQVGDSVVSGGKHDDVWEYGGRGNLTINVDTQKLGLWPGGFFTAELEGNYSTSDDRFADSINGKTGTLMPVNTNQLFPVPLGNNLNVPQVAFAQFLSPYAGVLAGKLDTISGDANEFAHGKGDRQFMNLAFNLNPATAVTVPYSTLGAGIIVLPTKDPHEAIVNFMVLQANGTASTSGFEDLAADKLTFAGGGRVRTRFAGYTGHQLVGGTYSNKEFTSIDQRLGFALQNERIAQKDGSWVVYYNFDQYLWEPDGDGKRGIGVFGRFGASDGNPNPMHYFYSLGVGGKGAIPRRPDDQFGLGYYYISINSPTFQRFRQVRSFLRDEWGFEAYYNVAVTPWLLITPDVQVLGPAQKQEALGLVRRAAVDTAVVLGFRVQVIF